MDDLAKENLKRCLAIGMVILAVFVIVCAMGMRQAPPLIPSLTPLFGVKFGIIFLLFLIGYCYYFDIKKGFWWIIGVWIAGTLAYSTGIGGFFRHPASMHGVDWVVTGNSCLCALAIGINVLRGKL